MALPTAPAFTEHASDGRITRIALQLLAERDGVYDAAGTAVVIAPWIAITARHVLEDYWRTFEGGQMVNGGEGSFCLRAFQVIDEGKVGVLYKIEKVVLATWTDIAVIKLIPWSGAPADYAWMCPKIDLLPPRLGARVCAFGYHAANVDVDGKNVSVTRRLATSVGEVIEIHAKGRDRQLSWPCFRTNARYDAGMSGGPVMNDDGHLCGIICKNLPPSQEGEEHVSYVTTLWPLMGCEIDFDRYDRPPATTYPMLDLVASKLIDARGAEHVVLQYDDQGRVCSVGVQVVPVPR
jgi:Trypsin-like peptidase domain